MTKEENLKWLDVEIQTWESECQSKHPIKEALYAARKALEQEPCEDAVSRQAVIDMTGLSEWFDSSDSYNEFVIALSELPPVIPQEPRWIPVTERLPEEGQMVIACYPTDCGKRVMTAYYYKGCGFSCGITYAWMPLPESYKGGQEDGKGND